MAPNNNLHNLNKLEVLSRQAQAFLFAEGGPISIKKLAQLTECKNDSELLSALQLLSEKFMGGGISLILTETEAALVVSPEASSGLKKAFDLELSREIGDAGLEVLSLLLYQGAGTRAQIDYVRGVNSSTTMRTLLARGLILRAGNPQDAREYVYRPSAELLAHLGVTDSKNLPDYDKISGELASFDVNKNPHSNENADTTSPGNNAASPN